SWTVCDVTDESALEAAVAAAEQRNGALRLAVMAAAIGSAGSILKTSAAECSATIDTNLLGVFRALQAEARAMKRAGGGSIVNVSSIAAALTHKWMSAYCASKAAVNMLTRCA